jgi:ferredoxin
MTKCLVCSCNKTMPLTQEALGQPVYQALCRHEVGDFLQSLETPDDVLVACTQEKPLFQALAQEKPQVSATGLRFFNIREVGGWSDQASSAIPKIKALMAHAALPVADPVPSVSYVSQGRLLVVGPATLVSEAMQGAALFDGLVPTGLIADLDGPLPPGRSRPVLTGELTGLTGYLGQFKAQWAQRNPIDLEICTRCGACQQVCPEQAITEHFQIDPTRCQSSRDCVKACDVVGAIQFDRLSDNREESFDLVLDLASQAAFEQPDPPKGYIHVASQAATGSGAIMKALAELAAQVGEFEKPKFFKYEQRLCAHGRNGKVGCSACIDVCSTLAIGSVFADGRGRVEVNPNLCMGCGACTTVCPSGAMRYAYPSADRIALEIRTLLRAYSQAGGKQPSLLLYGETQELGGGWDLIEQYGRLAQQKKAPGLPAHVLPLSLHHIASVGLEVWLAALCYGASEVVLMLTGREAAQYAAALAKQVEVGQEILRLLGLDAAALRLVSVTNAAELASIWPSGQKRAALVTEPAGFALGDDKRTALETCVDHLIRKGQPIADRSALPAALPAGSPIGGLALNADRCTLCMSCVGACPEGALKDGGERPLLAFIERNCVQCGLCVKTCPESALSLDPRLAPLEDRREAVTIHESTPFCCIRCGKPFATKEALRAMLLRIGSHPAFAGEAAKRLEMCGDCRVVDMVEKEL